MLPCSCLQQLKMGGLLTTCIYFEEDETITHAHEDDSHEDEDDSHEDEDGWSNRATYGSNEHIVGMI